MLGDKDACVRDNAARCCCGIHEGMQVNCEGTLSPWCPVSSFKCPLGLYKMGGGSAFKQVLSWASGLSYQSLDSMTVV